jgi:tetratricopeptide (TPR) repeat protein
MMTNFSKQLFFILVLLCTSSFLAQNTIDSLSQELKKDDISVKEKASIYRQIAEECFDKREFPLALENDKKALSIYISLDNEIVCGEIYSHIGDIHFEINDYDNSLKNYLEALQLFENNKAYELLNSTKKTIGDLYLRLEQCDQAFKHLFKVKKYYLSNRQMYKEELPSLYQSIGIAYGKCSSLDSALFYFQEAVNQNKNPNNGSFLGGLLNNIGAIYSKKNENEKALEYYNQSLELFQKEELKIGIGVSISNIAYVYKKQGKYTESISLYLNALQLFEEEKSLIYLKDNYLNISEVYEKNNNLSEALRYNNLYLDLNDSITNSDIISRIGELQMQFEIKKKDQELKLLEQDKLIAEQENKLSEIRFYILIGGVILLILIGGLIFRTLKVSLNNTKLKQQVLKQEKEQLTLDLDFKNSELEGFALRIVEKNDLLQQLKNELKQINPDEPENVLKLKEISSSINNNLYIEKDRKEFEFQLDKTHQSFFLKLDKQFHDLTKNERRLCSLLVLELSSKDIATILNISPDSVKKARYRLRKKLNIDTEINISEFLKEL